MTAPAPRIETELGVERLCRGCQEWWPLDEEFWYFRSSDRSVMGHCRACFSERNRHNHQKRSEAA
jgi:hypothetical protein